MFKKITILITVFTIITLLMSPGGASKDSISIRWIGGKPFISLKEIISKFNLESSFDMVTQRGKLYKKSHQAVYSIGMAYLLIDGKLHKSSFRVRREKGAVLIPLDGGDRLLKSFFPGIKVRKRDNRLHFELTEESSHDQKDDRNSYPRNKKDRITFIIIDPGHGGKDPGAIGKGGLKEKGITLNIARHLERMVKSKYKDIRVRLTRKSDKFIELSRRTEIANEMLKKNENGLFLSIHVNASISKKISGFETYFLSQNPTNEEARNTAALENNVVILEDSSRKGKKKYGDIDYIEANMLTTQIQKESSLLARSIQNGMTRENKAFKARGVKKADFFVLRGALIPATLVEVGFITNKREAQYLKKAEHQKVIARGIMEGIQIFLRKYNRLLQKNQ